MPVLHLVRGAKQSRSQHQTQSAPCRVPSRAAPWPGGKGERLPLWERLFQPAPKLFCVPSLQFLKLWAACQSVGQVPATVIGRFENPPATTAPCPHTPCGMHCQRSGCHQPIRPVWAALHHAQIATGRYGLVCLRSNRGRAQPGQAGKVQGLG